MVGVVNPSANQTLESYSQNAVGKPVFVPFPITPFGGDFGDASSTEDDNMPVEDPYMPSHSKDDENKEDSSCEGDSDRDGDDSEKNRSQAGTMRTSLAGLVGALVSAFLLS